MTSHSAEWLFPDKRPMWDTTHQEMPFADCNWATTTDASVRKEPAMATTKNTAVKTATKTTKTATKKETTVKKEAKPKMTREERIAENDARIAAYAEQYQKPKFDELVNIFHVLNAADGRCDKVKPLFVNDQWKTLLAYMAYEQGWESNGFITRTQAYILHGEVNDDDKIVAFGPNYRIQNLWHESAVAWEFGEPQYDEERAAEVNQRGAELRKQRSAVRKHREMATKVFKATINGIEFEGTLKELQEIRDEMGVA